MKKITLGVFAFSIIALLGVGIVAAFPFSFGKGIMAREVSPDDQEAFQAFHDSLVDSIDKEDFESWKTLMESQITEDNFNQMVERHKQMETLRTAMQNARETGDFSEVQKLREEYGIEDFGGPHGMMGHMGMHYSYN